MYDQVKDQFNLAAGSYDEQRRKLIPCFDDFYGTVLELAGFLKKDGRILDIGAGTGLLAGMLARKFPAAEIALIDLSADMLKLAEERLAGHAKVEYVLGDYARTDFGSNYDLIVSALSIHHLNDADKRDLYRKVFMALAPGGIFINADQVLGETEALDDLYKRVWHGKVEATDLTPEELRAAYERTKLDKMATLTAQLGWLKEAGFTDVDCCYKYYNFVVITGRKV